MNRFARTELLLGSQAMDVLAQSHVVVAGLGAVGSYAVEGLVRAGIGRLTLVDFDVIQLSNINRQLYALESTLGRAKVEVARERVLDINPDCQVMTRSVFLDGETIPSLLDLTAQVWVDAIDSLNPKVGLLEAAVKAGMPVISSMGAATRLDPAMIRVGDISRTRHCPLARHIRKRLRRRGVNSGVTCVYSLELPLETSGPENPPDDDEDSGVFRGRPRQTLGSFSCITGIFGLTAAREVVFRLLKTLDTKLA